MKSDGALECVYVGCSVGVDCDIINFIIFRKLTSKLKRDYVSAKKRNEREKRFITNAIQFNYSLFFFVFIVPNSHATDEFIKGAKTKHE